MITNTERETMRIDAFLGTTLATYGKSYFGTAIEVSDTGRIWLPESLTLLASDTHEQFISDFKKEHSIDQ